LCSLRPARHPPAILPLPPIALQWTPFVPPLVIFFFIDPTTTGIYTLSLHDALPIFVLADGHQHAAEVRGHHHAADGVGRQQVDEDRKSTRLNSSHVEISYAVFCLKKKRRGSKTPWAGTLSGAPVDCRSGRPYRSCCC